MFKRHTHLAVAVLALAGGLGIGQQLTTDPEPVTFPEDICAGDEFPVDDNGRTLCLHSQGEGWRVLGD